MSAYFDCSEEWERSNEKVKVNSVELARFSTMHDIISAMTKPATKINLHLIDIFLLCLPSYTTPKILFDTLKARFNQTLESDDATQDQCRYKILAIIFHWMESSMSSNDICEPLVDSILDFITEIETIGNPYLISLIKQIKVKICSAIIEIKLISYRITVVALQENQAKLYKY